MFGLVSQKIASVFSSLMSSKRVTEDNIAQAIREIRLALLDADANYGIVKKFIARIKEQLIGQEVWKHTEPAQQFMACVREELQVLLNDDRNDIMLTSSPSVILMCGLQGNGKTTTSVKLAHYLQKERRSRVLLVPCDAKRYAAEEQLTVLARSVDVDVYDDAETVPANKATNALRYARKERYDVVIVDTAGRLHFDAEMMQELHSINEACGGADEKLFVMNLAIGQDIVRVAEEFHQCLGITGVILSMVDGDAKGGAVLSIKELLGIPIKFEGYGERVQELRKFHAASMADRMLGMGDLLNLMREARECISEQDEVDLEEKLTTASFTYEDYYKQIRAFRRMGSMQKILSMMPKIGRQLDKEQIASSEEEMKRTEAMILSMTRDERVCRVALDMSRIKRIAAGSGTTIGEVNQMRKKLDQAKKFFKGMTKEKMEQLSKKMRGGSLWR